MSNLGHHPADIPAEQLHDEQEADEAAHPGENEDAPVPGPLHAAGDNAELEGQVNQWIAHHPAGAMQDLIDFYDAPEPEPNAAPHVPLGQALLAAHPHNPPAAEDDEAQFAAALEANPHLLQQMADEVGVGVDDPHVVDVLPHFGAWLANPNNMVQLDQWMHNVTNGAWLPIPLNIPHEILAAIEDEFFGPHGNDVITYEHLSDRINLLIDEFRAPAGTEIKGRM